MTGADGRFAMKWSGALSAVVVVVVFGVACRAQSVEYTDAITRQVLVVNSTPIEYTDAITRQVLVINSTPVEYADAITRQVLVYHPPYATVDVQKALAIAAGLLAATQANVDRLNIIRDGASASKVDMRDAARIARMAMGLDP